MNLTEIKCRCESLRLCCGPLAVRNLSFCVSRIRVGFLILRERALAFLRFQLISLTTSNPDFRWNMTTKRGTIFGAKITNIENLLLLFVFINESILVEENYPQDNQQVANKNYFLSFCCWVFPFKIFHGDY